MLNWTYIKSDDKRTLFIIDDEGEAATISDAHPNFDSILHILEDGGEYDERLVKRLLDPEATMSGLLVWNDEEKRYYLGGEPIKMARLTVALALDTILDVTEKKETNA